MAIFLDLHLEEIASRFEGIQGSTRFSLSMEMSRLAQDGTAEHISRDQILRREQRGQRNNIYYFLIILGWPYENGCALYSGDPLDQLILDPIRVGGVVKWAFAISRYVCLLDF